MDVHSSPDYRTAATGYVLVSSAELLRRREIRKCLRNRSFPNLTHIGEVVRGLQNWR